MNFNFKKSLYACLCFLLVCSTNLIGVEKNHFQQPLSTLQTLPILQTSFNGSQVQTGDTTLGWKPYVDPYGQIFPSLLLATATAGLDLSAEDYAKSMIPTSQTKPKQSTFAGAAMGNLKNKVAPKPVWIGDRKALIGIRVTPPSLFSDSTNSAQLSIEILENKLMQESYLNCTIHTGVASYLIQPQTIYKYDELSKVKESFQLPIQFVLKLNGNEIGRKTVDATVHSINDCIIYYQDKNNKGKYEDLGWMLAAYVDEDDPMIRSILHKAVSQGMVEDFEGYLTNNLGYTLLQVFAIWDSLERKGIASSMAAGMTSNIAPNMTSSIAYGMTSNIAPNMTSQSAFQKELLAKFSPANISLPIVSLPDINTCFIHFINQTLRYTEASASANSNNQTQITDADLSVLMASALRKVGINCYLILEPNHIYLAFDLGPNRTSQSFLEMSYLGSSKFLSSPSHVNPFLSKQVSKSKQQLPSWKSFNAALNAGKKFFLDNKKKYDSGAPNYQIISIERARQKGVAPIVPDNIFSDVKAIGY